MDRAEAVAVEVSNAFVGYNVIMESLNTMQDRIETRAGVLLGKPIIRGTCISVEHIVGLLGQGWTEADILPSYPTLSREDLLASLSYAPMVLAAESVFPASTQS
jgi:uncharacterized protein (DUF433 family)